MDLIMGQRQCHHQQQNLQLFSHTKTINEMKEPNIVSSSSIHSTTNTNTKTISLSNNSACIRIINNKKENHSNSSNKDSTSHVTICSWRMLSPLYKYKRERKKRRRRKSEQKHHVDNDEAEEEEEQQQLPLVQGEKNPTINNRNFAATTNDPATTADPAIIDIDDDTPPPYCDVDSSTGGDDCDSKSNTCTNSTQNSQSTASVVSFGRCDIRTYNQVIGDHPCCLEGCPIQLGWEYNQEISVDVDEYENMKQKENKYIPVAADAGEIHTTVNVTSRTRTSLTATNGDDDDDHHHHQTVYVPSIGLAPIPIDSLRLSPEERKEILIKQMVMICNNVVGNSGNGGGNNDTITTTATSVDMFYSERDLFRECRKLNRYKGRSSWMNTYGSVLLRNNPNLRNQKLYFGT